MTAIPHRRAGKGWRWASGGSLLHVTIVALMVIWFTPILGLFVSSIRSQSEMATTGWWHVLVEPLFTGYNFQQAIRLVHVGDSAATSLAIAMPGDGPDGACCPPWAPSPLPGCVSSDERSCHCCSSR